MSVRRAHAYTFTFAAVDSSSPPDRLPGISWTAGDAQISKDGGAFANTTNLPTQIGSTGRYAIALTAAELDCSWLHLKIEKATIQPIDITGGTTGGKTGVVVSDAGNSSAEFRTDLTESAANHWATAFLTFTTGALAGQTKRITGFNPTTDFVTVDGGFSSAPTAGDRFVIVNL